MISDAAPLKAVEHAGEKLPAQPGIAGALAQLFSVCPHADAASDDPGLAA
jgi:hypothetical protein